MALMVGMSNNIRLNDIDVPPVDPQCIGGLRDGDGDTGHVDPLGPPEIQENKSPE